MRRTKVILVCMVDSIHVARWLSHFVDEQIEFSLFPSGPNRRIHPQITNLVGNSPRTSAQFSIAPWARYLSVPLWIIDRILSDRLRGWMLKRLIDKVCPHYIHALELQHAGYIVDNALKGKGIEVPFIATNYGSDIFWFQQYPKHRRKIRSLLNKADFYSAECDRDYKLAIEFGFTGVMLPRFPNAGAIGVADLAKNKTPANLRNIIAVKGYQEWVGRARAVVQALKLRKDDLRDAEIVFFSCGTGMLIRVWLLKLTTGLNVRGYKKRALQHGEMLDLFSESRIYVGVSLSDGLSTSSIEAMAMGAFPLQSDTSCASEWFLEGVSGISIQGVSPNHIGELLVKTFNYGSFLESARLRNLEIVSSRFKEVLQSKHFKSFYGLD